MAAFCSSCGGKLEPGAKFCNQCGQAVANAPAAATQPVASAPAAGGGALKIILVVVAVLGFCMLLGIGSCFYIGYRIKQRAHQISQSYGSTSAPYQGKRDACGLVTKTEVSHAFGMQIESVSGEGASCQFRFAGDGSRQLAINVTWEGGTMLMKLGHAAMKSISAGMDTFTPVAGLGDEAYVEPMGSGLMMRKGDVMVHIDLRMAGNDADAAKKVGAKIAARL
jgi:hypothetical protein